MIGSNYVVFSVIDRKVSKIWKKKKVKKVAVAKIIILMMMMMMVMMVMIQFIYLRADLNSVWQITESAQ
jgi:hypothetical protein